MNTIPGKRYDPVPAPRYILLISLLVTWINK